MEIIYTIANTEQMWIHLVNKSIQKLLEEWLQRYLYRNIFCKYNFDAFKLSSKLNMVCLKIMFHIPNLLSIRYLTATKSIFEVLSHFIDTITHASIAKKPSLSPMSGNTHFEFTQKLIDLDILLLSISLFFFSLLIH